MPRALPPEPLRNPSHRRLGFPCAASAEGSRWVHFVGIGGTGLSPLALLALKQGWKVSGSDATWSNKLRSLEEAGAIVHAGHDERWLRDCGIFPDAVVVSSAIPAENEEVVAARRQGLRVIKRKEWLGEITEDYELIAVAGTHGKSTTTAMLTVVLQSFSDDITAIVGADVPQLAGGNMAYGKGGRFVLEADEYDGCFLGVSPSLAIVTSVEWEHVDMFPDEASVREMFKHFISRIKPDGCLIICGDSAGTRSLITSLEQYSKQASRKLTYGLHEQNDWRAIMLVPNILGGTDYVAVYRNRPMARVSLKLPGTYNVLNSLAVLAAVSLLAFKGKGSCDESGQLKAMAVAAQAASSALQSFQGLRRRFEYVGTVRRCDIYDDYAHHPTEVRAVLQAARQRFDKQPIWVVFQPHTYSRIANLLQDFAPAFSGANRVIVTEIFSARENNVWELSGADLVSVITGPPAMFIPTLDEVIERLSWELTALEENEVNKGGNIVLLTLGAGDVTSVGPKLLDALASSRERD
ncbi:uncharacterized protein LOC9632341 [Selaginella moellendorffii]|uniref:uncharacterized protein LOC9632341 n=1 Tax=Selaginella moellendorffii TaxID=88036 RepID=UPI000D1CEFB1|nr:uncharacterized protein LOC9632341 [Selaginella moellendorffii]|eukprot:XP_024528113.1 uncharacterized protein LOC9632341 [Selaginella moellendorffii]